MGWALSEEERLERLIAVERALASGSDLVKYADKTVKYRSPEALEMIAQRLRASLGMTKSQETGVPNQVLPITKSGWNGS